MLLTALLSSFAVLAPVREDERDLTELSIEELLQVRLEEVGVPGIHHVHRRGELMLGYVFGAMWMDGNRDGTDRVGTAAVLDEFPVAPTEMRMQMHMFHLMYGVSERVTAVVMLPWVELEMEHRTRAGAGFTTRSDGLGDVRLSGLYSLDGGEGGRGEGSVTYVDFGVSLPTGSIDEEDETPMSGGEGIRLPYPMQLGSGTFDLLPAITHVAQSGEWTFGGRAFGTLRLGENDNDYRLGNVVGATAWSSRRWSGHFSTSLRLEGRHWGDVAGADPLLDPTVVPTADPGLRGGERVDGFFGANLFDGGERGTLRLGTEVGLPLYQDLDGPQLETDLLLRVELQWTR